jgi:hypothetical protein
MLAFDGAAAIMTEHHDERHPEHRNTVFEAGDHLGSADVAGDPADKDMADALVEDELDGHTGVGTGQDGRERLLLGDRFLLQDCQVFVERREASTDEPGVPVRQLPQRCIRRLAGLGAGRTGRRQRKQSAQRRGDHPPPG